MEAEVLAGLIGFGGAVFGAVIGGGTSLLATKLNLTHQREQAREAHLLTLGQTVAETALSELITTDEFLRSIRWIGVEAETSGGAPWNLTSMTHIKSVELSVARLPNREFRERVRISLKLARRYRAAGPRDFLGVRWVLELTEDMIAVLSAYLCHDDVPPLPEGVIRIQEKLARYEEASRQQAQAIGDEFDARLREAETS
ncbi:hypothetical protein ACWCO9_07085 [Streptomyces sp. NPDC001937]